MVMPVEGAGHLARTPMTDPAFASPHVNRIVDNLPVATKVVSDVRPNDPYYIRGFPVGGILDDKHFLFNHIRLVISYNEDHNPGAWPADSAVLGLVVEWAPLSVLIRSACLNVGYFEV